MEEISGNNVRSTKIETNLSNCKKTQYFVYTYVMSLSASSNETTFLSEGLACN